MKKLKFLFKDASQKSRILAIIAAAMGVLIIALAFIGANNAINNEITKIPFIAMLGGEAVDEIEDAMDDALDAIDEVIAESDDETIEALEDEFGLSVKEIRKTLDPLSLKNLSTLFDIMSDKINMPNIIAIFISVINGYAWLIAVITLFATVFLKKGLMIFAYIVSFAFFIVFVGMPSFIIATLAFIAFLVLTTLVNKEYKDYQLTARAEELIEKTKTLEEEKVAE